MLESLYNQVSKKVVLEGYFFLLLHFINLFYFNKIDGRTLTCKIPLDPNLSLKPIV